MPKIIFEPKSGAPYIMGLHFSEYDQWDQIKEDDVDGVYSTNGRDESTSRIADVGIDKLVILKWILRKQSVKMCKGKVKVKL
jgi:hypothetical protein